MGVLCILRPYDQSIPLYQLSPAIVERSRPKHLRQFIRYAYITVVPAYLLTILILFLCKIFSVGIIGSAIDIKALSRLIGSVATLIQWAILFIGAWEFRLRKDIGVQRDEDGAFHFISNYGVQEWIYRPGKFDITLPEVGIQTSPLSVFAYTTTVVSCDLVMQDRWTETADEFNTALRVCGGFAVLLPVILWFAYTMGERNERYRHEKLLWFLSAGMLLFHLLFYLWDESAAIGRQLNAFDGLEEARWSVWMRILIG